MTEKPLKFWHTKVTMIILISFGIFFSIVDTEKGDMTFGYWIIYMIMIFIFVVIPINIALLLCDFEDLKRKSKKLLEKSYSLADLINKTTNETIFFNSYNELITIFEELSLYEKYRFFKNKLPSKQLVEIKEKRELAYLEFKQRQIEKQKKYESLKLANITLVDADCMEGHDFEYFCADLLRKNGFINVEVTQGSGDHGIDILSEKDDITYAIQCKCYSSNIGNAAVQQAHTGKSLYNRNIAVVMTNNYFTAQAKSEANTLGVKLWDRDKLKELIEKSI